MKTRFVSAQIVDSKGLVVEDLGHLTPEQFLTKYSEPVWKSYEHNGIEGPKWILWKKHLPDDTYAILKYEELYEIWDGKKVVGYQSPGVLHIPVDEAVI